MRYCSAAALPSTQALDCCAAGAVLSAGRRWAHWWLHRLRGHGTAFQNAQRAASGGERSLHHAPRLHRHTAHTRERTSLADRPKHDEQHGSVMLRAPKSSMDWSSECHCLALRTNTSRMPMYVICSRSHSMHASTLRKQRNEWSPTARWVFTHRRHGSISRLGASRATPCHRRKPKKQAPHVTHVYMHSPGR